MIQFKQINSTTKATDIPPSRKVIKKSNKLYFSFYHQGQTEIIPIQNKSQLERDLKEMGVISDGNIINIVQMNGRNVKFQRVTFSKEVQDRLLLRNQTYAVVLP